MATTGGIGSNAKWLIKTYVYNSLAFVTFCMNMLFL